MKIKGLGALLGAILLIPVMCFVAKESETAIANTINGAGLPGIIGTLLMAVFAGAFILHVIRHIMERIGR